MHAPANDRLNWLRSAQNPDGGWGYHAGKQSWLEPTLYASLALLAWQAHEPALSRAWNYTCGLQRADGSWQAARHVEESHWSGSLCLHIALLRGPPDESFFRGLHTLLNTTGSEGRISARLGQLLDPTAVEYDRSLRGWPWTPGTSSWIEPTCHALMTLSRVKKVADSPQLRARIDEGRRLLLDRRCRDGGWNYGNRRVRNRDLPGYPETTALALAALVATEEPNLNDAIARSLALFHDPPTSRFARAWLGIALASAGRPVPLADPGPGVEVVTCALEAIAWSERGLL